jgi:hypothetical protein
LRYIHHDYVIHANAARKKSQRAAPRHHLSYLAPRYGGLADVFAPASLWMEQRFFCGADSDDNRAGRESVPRASPWAAMVSAMNFSVEFGLERTSKSFDVFPAFILPAGASFESILKQGFY